MMEGFGNEPAGTGELRQLARAIEQAARLPGVELVSDGIVGQFRHELTLSPSHTLRYVSPTNY